MTLKLNSLARARTELAAYCIAAWPRFELAPHHRLLIDYLERVERGEIDRLMVFMPPRHGKSLIASQLYPAWYLGRHPERSIIATSYGQELASDQGRKAREYASGDIHRLVFPEARIRDDSAAVHRFGLMAGGHYYAVGAGGPITGRGADLLLIDDPLKGSEDAYSVTARKSLQTWYEMVLYPRLQPGGAIVLIQTRWHMDDLAGWLLREHTQDRWTVLSLPAVAEPDDPLGRAEGEALWPGHFDIAELDRRRASMGSVAFAAMYQQRPVALEGAVFKREWIQTYTAKPDFTRLIFSLDTAFKTGESNDYSVLVVWAESVAGFYLLDVVRERLDFPSLKSRVVAKAAWWKPHAVLIEDAASGQSLIQTLRLETSLPLLPVRPLGDKIGRASAVSPLFESGRVFIPQAAPWLSDYVDELTSFPASPHDDQVDATTQALTWLRGERREYAYTPAPRATTDLFGGTQPAANGTTPRPRGMTWAAREGWVDDRARTTEPSILRSPRVRWGKFAAMP